MCQRTEMKDCFREFNNTGAPYAGALPVCVNVIGADWFRGFFNKVMLSWRPALCYYMLQCRLRVRGNGVVLAVVTNKNRSRSSGPTRGPAHALGTSEFGADRLYPCGVWENLTLINLCLAGHEMCDCIFDRTDLLSGEYALRRRGRRVPGVKRPVLGRRTGCEAGVSGVMFGGFLLLLSLSGSAFGVRWELSAGNADFYTDKPP